MRQFGIANERIITVFGGSGFLGRHVVRALADRGWRIRAATRRPDLAGHLQPLGRVGQIHAVQANLRYPASLAGALRGADAVVNLVGVLSEQGRQNFEAVHTFGARAIARAAQEHGIETMVHVSALGADPASTSDYARTKGRAELAIRELLPQATILRPSVLFGPEDTFFNRFAAMARFSPILPLPGGGTTKFQPAFVGDVAEAIARALEGRSVAGQTYELGGPVVRSFRELMAFVCEVTGRKRALLPLPTSLLHYPALFSEIANGLTFGALPPAMLLTRDQLKLLGGDNVVSAEAVAQNRTFAGFDIMPQGYEAIVPAYLYRYRKTGQFAKRGVPAESADTAP